MYLDDDITLHKSCNTRHTNGNEIYFQQTKAQQDENELYIPSI